MRHLLFLCLLAMTLYVQGIHSHNRSSYPFISDLTFRTLANGNDTGRLRPGDIVFVDSLLSMENFFRNTHPRIKVPYILITHSGWPSVPGKLARYLDDPKIIAWFTKNMDRNHPKLHPLPIGLANKGQPHGNTDVIKKAIESAPVPTSRRTDKLVYVNITLCTNERKALLNSLKNEEFCQCNERKPFAQYMKELSQFRFVVSPHGIGIDCHRTWEAMLVGTIPIVRRSSIVELFDDLPVLIIDSWDELTRELLEEKFEEITSKSYNLKKLYADYWFDQIRKVQPSYRNT